MSELGQCDINKTALLDEYRSLRAEILQRQHIRILVLSFTMAAVGVSLGILFGIKSPSADYNQYLVDFLINFLLIVINGALILTLENTQQIYLISQYIIKYIEPEFGTFERGMGWETRWTTYWIRKHGERKYSLPGYPWADQRGLALFYYVLIMATVLVLIIEIATPSRLLSWYGVGLSIFLICCALGLCSDLYFRITKGWDKNPWQHL